VSTWGWTKAGARRLVAEEGEGSYGGSGGGGGGTRKLRRGAQRLRGVSSSARGEGAGGASWQRLAKCEGVQGWSMWVSRPLGYALHSISLLRGKRFLGVSIGRSFPFGCAGPTEEHSPLFLGLCVVIYLAPRRREAHVLFFPRKVLSGFAVPFFIAFRAKSFRPHDPSRLFFFSARAAHLAWRGGRARCSCRA
jgi:hypothetical protein